MKALYFELKKIQNKRLIILLFLVPIIVTAGLYTYRSNSSIDFRRQEQQTANRLLSDLSWRLAEYNDQRGYYGPSQNQANNPDELTEHQQYIYDLLDASERERFHYSVAAYHENWADLNQSKQKIWLNLLKVIDAGENLRSLNHDELIADTYKLDWLIEHNIDHLDFETDNHSAFVLFNSFQLLLGLPAIVMIIYLFGLESFLEAKREQFNFSRVLPIPYAKVLFTKLKLFISMLVIYLVMSLLTLGMFSLLLDENPLTTQLNYPIVSTLTESVIVKPLWEVFTYQIIGFILLSLLSLILISILAFIFGNELFVSFLFATFFTTGIQINQLYNKDSQFYNPFAWFNSNYHIIHNSRLHLVLTASLLVIFILILFFFVFLKGAYLRPWSFKDTYKQKHSLNKLFFVKFEWLKIRRQNFLFYSLAIVFSFVLTLAISQFQQYTNDLSTLVERNEAAVADQARTKQLFEESITSIELILADEELQNFDRRQYEEQLEYLRESYSDTLANHAIINQQLIDIKANDYRLFNQEATDSLEQDYHFVMGKAEVQFSRRIPLRHHIFVPNAYINYELSQWKQKHSIDFVPLGGPFHTLFIPEYEETPRSGENQPPLSIDQAVFENYLTTVSKPHQYISGLNLSASLLTDSIYLILLITIIVFFATSYATELDNRQTIRYLVTQPKTLVQIISTKLKVAYAMTFLFILLSLLITFTIGSLFNGPGQMDFPFIQYIAKSIGDSNEFSYFNIPSFNEYFQILPLWKLVLMGLALLLSNAFVAINLTYFISTAIKNRWLVATTSILFLGIGMVFFYYIPNQLQQFSPFAYLNIADVLSGESSITHNYQYFNWITGVSSQFVFGLILSLLTFLRVRKKAN
ncbi:hypothetical protein ACTQ45_04315 [Fundicoccus sp. Sow4_D5]|uniref:hypothetical protein n=1 Tax=Fundicoccus sp. Sow4_D5 TaxID=3438782 RepID=UPI003F8F3FC6